MKLINKLLPVATLGSVAAIVTPLTTSCASGYTYNIDLLKTIDTNGWVFAEYDGDVDPEQAVEDYYEAISEDHDILIHDYMWGNRVYIVSECAELMGADEAKFGQTSVQFSDIKVEQIDDYLALSFKTKFDVEFKAKIGAGEYVPPALPDGIKMEAHSTATLNKVPYMLIPNSGKLSLPTFQPTIMGEFIEPTPLDFDWDWSIDINGTMYNAEIKYDTDEVFMDENIALSAHADKDNTINVNSQLDGFAYSTFWLLAGCVFHSYYFLYTNFGE